MSITIIDRVIAGYRGEPAKKLILILLANRINDSSGVCYPSIAKLAEEANVSERTVQRLMSSLIDDGIVIVMGNFGGGRNVTRRYRIDFRSLEKGDTDDTLLMGEKGDEDDTLLNQERVTNPVTKGDSGDTLSNHKRVTDSVKRVTNPVLKGDTVVTRTVSEPLVNRIQVETEKNPVSTPDLFGDSEEQNSAPKKTAKKLNGHVPFDRILDLYRTRLPNLSQPRLLTEKRKVAIKARWYQLHKLKRDDGTPVASTEEQAIGFFDWFFHQVADDHFLTGGNDRGWKADLDFLMGEKNFIKIVEKGSR